MSTLALITSSPGPASRLEQVHHATLDALRATGERVRTVQLRDVPESALISGDTARTEVRRTRQVLDAAEGVVVVTPAYDLSSSRLLRTWLNLMPGLRGRTVQTVALGTTHAQSCGADYSLRRMLSDHEPEWVAPVCFLFERWFDRAGLNPYGRGVLHRALGEFHTALDESAPGQPRCEMSLTSRTDALPSG